MENPSKTDILTVAKARLPKALAEMGRKSAKAIENPSSIITFGDAATIHLANIAARVELKPATKHYWRQIVDALLASWPGLVDTKMVRIYREPYPCLGRGLSTKSFRNTV
jgi:hypothetical protein